MLLSWDCIDYIFWVLSKDKLVNLVFECFFYLLSKLCPRLFKSLCKCPKLLDSGAVCLECLIHRFRPTNKCSFIRINFVSLLSVYPESNFEYWILIPLLLLVWYLLNSGLVPYLGGIEDVDLIPNLQVRSPFIAFTLGVVLIEFRGVPPEGGTRSIAIIFKLNVDKVSIYTQDRTFCPHFQIEITASFDSINFGANLEFLSPEFIFWWKFFDNSGVIRGF